MNLVDSCGWLEYFADAPNADYFAESIEDIENLLVPSLCILEVFKSILRQRDEDAALQAVALMEQGLTVALDTSIALSAAKLGLDYRLPLADSVIAGVYPGTTNWLDIFNPNDTVVATIHPTEETYYLAACVHFATLFGQTPVGLTNQTYAAEGWAFDPPTIEQAIMMQQIAWEIVSNDAYACMPTETGNYQISSIKKAIKVTSYPNPFVNKVAIRTNDYSFNNAEFNLYDILGEQKRNIQNINGTEFSIVSKGLPSGIYIYHITDENGLSLNGRLIVK